MGLTFGQCWLILGSLCELCSVSLFELFNGVVAQCACVLPKSLRGIWISSNKGPLNFTDRALVQYPLDVSVAISSLTFTCNMTSGDKYMLRSDDTFMVYGISFYAYLCLELHQVSPYKFWYHVANDIDGTVLDRVFVKPSVSSVNITNGCRRTKPYEVSTFNTLVKEGTLETGLVEATCPYELLHTFANGSMSTSDQMTSCTNVTLDMCQDKTKMIHTYDPSCPNNVKSAVQGIYICLHYLTDETAEVTYLHVWNTDTSLAADTNRIHCYAYEIINNTMSATLHPGSCHVTQTASSVPSQGFHAEFNTITRTCQRTVVDEPRIVFFVSVALGSMFFLAICVLVACIIYKTKCICVRELCQKLCRRPIIGQSLASLAVKKEEGNGRYLRSARKSLAPGMFVARKPIKIGPIIEPYLEPPAKIELLYDKDQIKNGSQYMFSRLFQSQVSLKC